MTNVLEEHNCFVEKIIENVAYVTLIDAKDQSVLWGECPADELAALGISRRFLCRVVDKNGELDIEMIPIPDRELTEDRYKEIDVLLQGIDE